MPAPAAHAYLSPMNADKIVSRALALQLWLKYGLRSIRDLDTTADLRAEPSAALDTRGSICSELCFVREKDSRYRWDRFSSEVDDGDAVLRPADVALDQTGRWIRAPFRDFHRKFYLQHVQLIDARIPFRSPEDENGEPVGPSLLQLCAGKLPALFICFGGKDKMIEASQVPIAQRLQHLLYTLKVIARGLTGEPAARLGSPDEADHEQDRSASEIIGDLDWYLSAHNNLNRLVGLGRMKIGSHRPASGFGQDLILMDTLDIQALVTIETPNEPQDLQRPDLFRVQLQRIADDKTTTNVGDPMQVQVNR